MTIEQKQRIADEYVKTSSFFECAVYCGRHKGTSLFGIKRNTHGHIGMPVYVTINDDGGLREINDRLAIFDAIRAEVEYSKNTK